MVWQLVYRTIDENFTKVWTDTGEHKARIRLGLGCHLQAHGKCGCAVMTQAMLAAGDPTGARILEIVADKDGYEVIEHKDARAEPLEFEESDFIYVPGQIIAQANGTMAGTAVKRARSEEEQDYAPEKKAPAKLSKLPRSAKAKSKTRAFVPLSN